MLEIEIDPESRADLETNHTARCLFSTKLALESRQPRDIKIWVEGLVEKACQALLRCLGRDAGSFSKQTVMIQLRRRHAYVCFDIFLPECDERVRADAGSSYTLPIYEIRKAGKVYVMRRNKGLDAVCTSQYTKIRTLDKGGRPYFDDLFSAHVYEDGILIETFPNGDK